MVLLNKKGDENGPLGMCMDTTARPSVKCGEEQRRASRRFEGQGFPDIFSGFGRVFRRGVGENKDVVRFHQFFLDTTRGDEDVLAMADGGTAASSWKALAGGGREAKVPMLVLGMGMGGGRCGNGIERA